MAGAGVLRPVAQSTLADAVTAHIRASIVSGQLRPARRLSEPTLAAQLGVSRSPVREALHRLEGEGLVVSHPNRGCTVWAPTEADVDEIFSLRIMIESLAAERMINLLNEEDFMQLEAIIERQRQLIAAKDYLRLIEEDKRFHEYVCCKTGHARLMEWWQQIMGQWQVLIYRRVQYDAPTLNDHLDILNALRRRDLPAVLALHRSINQRVVDHIKTILHDPLPEIQSLFGP
jgi:DNA-binding GntR family transcriptional regulator